MNTAKAPVSGRKTKADATISEYPDCSHDTQKDIIRILESKKVAEVTMSKRTKCETWLYRYDYLHTSPNNMDCNNAGNDSFLAIFCPEQEHPQI